MIRVPLYLEPVKAPVELVAPQESDPHCRRCALHKSAGHVCVPGEGAAGGVLLVGEGPGRDEDKAGRPFVGKSGQYLRAQVVRHWQGPVAYGNATGCFPGADKERKLEAAVVACRGFLAGTLRSVKPQRIVALGSRAVGSLLGRTPAMLSVRRGFGWLSDGTPVFQVLHPAAALRNRFHKAWFEEDLGWALTTSALPAPPWQDTFAHVVETEDDALEASRALYSVPWFTFDVEARGVQFNADYKVVAAACCGAGSRVSWVWDYAAMENPMCVGVLKGILLRPPLVAQDAKYDMLAARLSLGVVVRRLCGDTRLWRKQLYSDADGDLATMSELVGWGGHKDEAQQEIARIVKHVRGKNAGQISWVDVPYHQDKVAVEGVRAGKEEAERYAYALLPVDVMRRYVGRDAMCEARLGELLEPLVRAEPHHAATWDGILAPASVALEQVEAWGMGANRGAMDAFAVYLQGELAQVDKRIAVYKVDPDSPVQVADLLFDKLKLTPKRDSETETGKQSTRKGVLEDLVGEHPIVADVLEHRRLSKLLTGGAASLVKYIRDDGRIHPRIHADGARSGRLSCSDPNLQNVKRPDVQEGKMLRDCFVADSGNLLVEADYSQIEVRVADMLSGDPVLRALLDRGEDVHQSTAMLVSKQAWGIAPDQVQPRHRQAAKTVVFRTLYGGRDAGLAAMLHISVAEATRIREAIFGKMHVLAAWIKKQISDARRTGGVWTFWDGRPARWRWLTDVASQDGERRSTAENGCFNSPIQGTANEFCLMSLVECVNWLLTDCFPARLCMTIHDSLLFEVCADALSELVWQVNRIMLGWNSMGVPLKVDFKVGDAWGSMRKLTAAEKAASGIG